MRLTPANINPIRSYPAPNAKFHGFLVRVILRLRLAAPPPSKPKLSHPVGWPPSNESKMLACFNYSYTRSFPLTSPALPPSPPNHLSPQIPKVHPHVTHPTPPPPSLLEASKALPQCSAAPSVPVPVVKRSSFSRSPHTLYRRRRRRRGCGGASPRLGSLRP